MNSNSDNFHLPGAQRRCCLIDKNKKCLRTVGLTTFSRKMQAAVNATQKKSRLQLENYPRHYLLCEYHRNVVDRLVNKFNKKMMNEETDEELIVPPNRTLARSPSPKLSKGKTPQVDLSVLSASSIKRCKKFLKIQSRLNLNKHQLTEVVQRHFSSIPVNETEVIDYFLYSVKSRQQNVTEDSKK